MEASSAALSPRKEGEELAGKTRRPLSSFSALGAENSRSMSPNLNQSSASSGRPDALSPSSQGAGRLVTQAPAEEAASAVYLFVRVAPAGLFPLLYLDLLFLARHLILGRRPDPPANLAGRNKKRAPTFKGRNLLERPRGRARVSSFPARTRDGVREIRANPSPPPIKTDAGKEMGARERVATGVAETGARPNLTDIRQASIDRVGSATERSPPEARVIGVPVPNDANLNNGRPTSRSRRSSAQPNHANCPPTGREESRKFPFSIQQSCIAPRQIVAVGTYFFPGSD